MRVLISSAWRAFPAPPRTCLVPARYWQRCCRTPPHLGGSRSPWTRAGWKEYENTNGRKYYHHVASGNTQWDAPPGWGQPRLALMHTPQTQLNCTPMQTPQTQKKYEGMKVDELKDALSRRKLRKSGKKADLVQVMMISTARHFARASRAHRALPPTEASRG